MTLAIGTRVTWRSQAAGTWRDKTGPVVAVVAPNKTGWGALAEAGISARPAGWSTGRFRRSLAPSYIVRDETTGRLYWPRVSALNPAADTAAKCIHGTVGGCGFPCGVGTGLDDIGRMRSALCDIRDHVNAVRNDADTAIDSDEILALVEGGLAGWAR